MTLPRLIFVTGKGGTGKSTVAAALAVSIARHRPAILAGLDRRRSAPRLLAGSFDWAAESFPIMANLRGLALDPHAELQKFIERIVPLKAISRRMLKSRTFGYVTAALPGLEAFLMLERLRLLAADCALQDSYLVVDGPASGSALELLSVVEGVKGIAPTGILNRLAVEVGKFLNDGKQFGVIITVTPEEMALREAIETASALAQRLRIGYIAAALNATAAPLFNAADLAALTLLKAHTRLALRRNAIAEYTVTARAQLRAAGLTTIELPALFRPRLGRAEISTLSAALEAAIFAI